MAGRRESVFVRHHAIPIASSAHQSFEPHEQVKVERGHIEDHEPSCKVLIMNVNSHSFARGHVMDRGHLVQEEVLDASMAALEIVL